MPSRVAIVTGGARGIGRAIARRLAREGVRVAVADVDAAAAAKAARAVGRGALAVACDVSRGASVRAMVAEVIGRTGRIDILVNNAGICPLRPLDAISEEEWDRVLAVNLKGAFLCAQAAVPHLKRRRAGRVINIGSVAGKMGGVLIGAHYAASKGGLHALTHALACQLAPWGITVNAVAPGMTTTDLIKGWSAADKRRVAEKVPLGRLGRPEDVAGAVAWLAGDEATFVTGEIVDVNGGFYRD